MAEPRLPIGRNSIQLAVITNVTKTFVECQYLSSTGESTFKCPLPFPYAGYGGGFLVGVEKGSIVMVSIGASTQHFIVGFVPMRQLLNGKVEGITNTSYKTTPFPELKEGELVIKSAPSGSYIRLAIDGSIELDAGLGDSAADIELSKKTKALFFRVDNKYSFTEAGRVVEGVIKRDQNVKEKSTISGTFDFLAGEEYDKILEPVGRSPGNEVQYRTIKMGRDFIRNPALVEKREIVYEYANSFGVRNLSAEVKALESSKVASGIENMIVSPESRNNRRTDVLDLNMFNYNHLIEQVKGTLVDIYGNILDINRNKINVPGVNPLESNEDGSSKPKDNNSELKNLYRYMRRSVKYHMEINSRKEIDGDEPPRNSFPDYAREHSRWSIDVDGEGLTKLNIPASSNTGNIPVLGRYITSADEKNRNSGTFKDKKRIDIRMAQFGPKDKEGNITGQAIAHSEYSPVSITSDEGNDNKIYKSVTTAGTAYHDLLTIAPLVFSVGGKLRNPNPGIGADVVPPLADSINNKIGDSTSNAGGRSVHANLDGSMEMSIGSDKADGKSLVMDCEGSVVSHYGKDKNQRSIIHQSDGDVIIQIGSDTDAGLDGYGIRPGRLEIHLARGEGNIPQKIIIDEQGLTLAVEGNILLSSSGNFTIGSGAKIVLAGELLHQYGAFDADVDGTRGPKGTEKMVIRNGMPGHS